MFLHLSVILFTGGGVSAPVHAGIHPPDQRQTPPGPEADTPLWAVRILLECILVTIHKRSCGKVMFLQVSVILFTGVGVASQHALQVVSQHALQVSRPTPKGELEGLARGSPGPHLGDVSQHALMQTLRADGYCCGRYASYWNAFLF